MAYKVAYDYEYYNYEVPEPVWRTTSLEPQVTVTASELTITVPAGYFSDHGVVACYDVNGRYIGLKLVNRSNTSCSFANPASIHDVKLFRLSDETDWNAARSGEALYTAGE